MNLSIMMKQKYWNQLKLKLTGRKYRKSWQLRGVGHQILTTNTTRGNGILVIEAIVNVKKNNRGNLMSVADIIDSTV